MEQKAVGIALTTKFLSDFKEVSDGNVYIIQRREEGKDGLTQLEITRDDAVEEILSLTYIDYCKGPEADRDEGGELWFFGKTIDDKEVYIKLKLKNAKGGGRIAVCIGFHIAEFPLSYPFK